MKKIILFRFHNHLTVCKNRVRLLRQFNPGISIYGLYGGEARNFQKALLKLGASLEHIYFIKDKSPVWKWMNSDLAVKSWFENYGKEISFDVVYIVEWDMLMLEAIDHIYENIPENAVGLSGLSVHNSTNSDWRWTSSKEFKAEMDRLILFIDKRFNYREKPYRCITGGTCLPRTFIEQYCRINIPELCNDEVRLPLFAQILGFKLIDTGFYDRLDENSKRFFNLNRRIDTEIIRSELHKPDGRRVFHPYYKVFNPLTFTEHAYNIMYDIQSKIKTLLKTVLGKKTWQSFKHTIIRDYRDN